MIVQNLSIEKVLRITPGFAGSPVLRDGSIEVSMTLVGFSSEADLDDWVGKLAEDFRSRYRVQRMTVG